MEPLSVEDQFRLAATVSQINQMSGEQAKVFAIELAKHNTCQKASFLKLLAHQWNIGNEKPHNLEQ